VWHASFWDPVLLQALFKPLKVAAVPQTSVTAGSRMPSVLLPPAV